MWGPAAIPQGPQPEAGFTFANPVPVIGRPVPGLAPVAPVIPGGAPAAPVPTAALTPAATNAGLGAAPSGPQPVIPGQERGPVRNAISRGREALGRVRERVSQPGPARDFVTDFAAGLSQPNDGRPLVAFLQAFAGGINSDRAREAAQAAAAAEAEERAYQRALNADERAYDRDRDRVEDERWRVENERAERTAEYANLRTEAEVRRIEREAERVLSPAEVISARTTANNWLNTQLDSYDNGISGVDAETRNLLTRQADDMYADLLEDAVRGRTGGTAAGTTPAAGSTAGAGARTPVHLQGIGTQAAPYSGNFTQEMIDGFPSGTWIRIPDPTSPTGYRDFQKP